MSVCLSVCLLTSYRSQLFTQQPDFFENMFFRTMGVVSSLSLYWPQAHSTNNIFGMYTQYGIERAKKCVFLSLFFLTLWGIFLTILSIFHLWYIAFGIRTSCFENMIFRSISRNSFNVVFLDFWKCYFRYFLSVNELHVTHFDPDFLFQIWYLQLHQEIFHDFYYSLPYLGGGAYENLRLENMALGAVLRSSALCLYDYIFLIKRKRVLMSSANRLRTCMLYA